MEGSFRKQKVSDDRQLEGIKEEIRRLKEEMNQEEAKKVIQQDESKKTVLQDEANKVIQQNVLKKTVLQGETIKTENTQESKNRKRREKMEKENRISSRIYQAVAVLLCLVMLSLWMLGNVYARYTTESSGRRYRQGGGFCVSACRWQREPDDRSEKRAKARRYL